MKLTKTEIDTLKGALCITKRDYPHLISDKHYADIYEKLTEMENNL